MLVSNRMITGFNTDVPHEGHVYHVQTEDGGSGNPILESLIYVGGTIVAKKLTPYAEQLVDGADQDAIASLLRRQHQVIIAAIKAGRIKDLIQHTQKQRDVDKPVNKPVDKPQQMESPKSPEFYITNRDRKVALPIDDDPIVIPTVTVPTIPIPQVSAPPAQASQVTAPPA